ncbi:hypothetical protein A0046_08440 [Campylobacter upsaliensis]|nr:hypothetical protein [Campylobacter upsaliensis]
MYLLAPIFWLLAFKKSFFGLAKFGLAFCLEFALPLGVNFPCRFRRVCPRLAQPCLTLRRRHTLDKFTLHTSRLCLTPPFLCDLLYPHTRQRQFRP